VKLGSPFRLCVWNTVKTRGHINARLNVYEYTWQTQPVPQLQLHVATLLATRGLTRGFPIQ